MSKVKVCKVCEVERPLTEFKVNEAGLVHAFCDQCRRNLRADHNAKWEHYYGRV